MEQPKLDGKVDSHRFCLPKFVTYTNTLQLQSVVKISKHSSLEFLGWRIS